MLRLLTRIVAGAYYFSPPLVNGNDEIVVLVHGLVRRGINMLYMARKLNRAGYAVYVYDYATTRKGIAAHGRDFRRYLERVALDNPGRKIHLVSHSMGGILIREALGHLAVDAETTNPLLDAKLFGRVVMLAPPNHGSDAARHAVKLLPLTRKLIKPLAELSSGQEAYIHRVPVPEFLDVGIVAGRFDMEVSEKYTRLYNMKDFTVINSEHSFMMYMPEAVRVVLKYLRDGSFR